MNKKGRLLIAAAVRSGASVFIPPVASESFWNTGTPTVKKITIPNGLREKQLERGVLPGEINTAGLPLPAVKSGEKIDYDKVFTKLQDEAEKSTLDLESKTKDQLLEYANLIGDVTVRKSWTKAKIIEAIKLQLGEPAKS